MGRVWAMRQRKMAGWFVLVPALKRFHSPGPAAYRRRTPAIVPDGAAERRSMGVQRGSSPTVFDFEQSFGVHGEVKRQILDHLKEG